MPETDLPGLVARAQRGDRAAFDRIVQHTARLVYAQVVGSLRDRQKAEDVTQETFLAAWKNITSVHSVETAGTLTWLLTLARNKVLDAIRFDTRKKRGGTEPGDTGAAAPVHHNAGEIPDERPLPDQAAHMNEARDRALRLLEELPEEYRRPLAMRYLAGADYETIRRGLNLSDGALRGLLNRGMALLRERMTRMDDTESNDPKSKVTR